MPRKTDAQAARSRRWLLEALVELMRDKPFESITVSEIAARADLDRRTFYRHFSTKEAVISHYIRQLAEQYETVLRAQRMNTREIALAFFTLCREQADLLELLHKNQLLPLLLYELNRIFPRLHSKYHTGPDPYAPHEPGYALAYHVGGFWNTLLYWLDDGMRKTPEELAETVQTFLPEYI